MLQRGQIIRIEQSDFLYTRKLGAGASGAPIINMEYKVVGIHRGYMRSAREELGRGIVLQQILVYLISNRKKQPESDANPSPRLEVQNNSNVPSLSFSVQGSVALIASLFMLGIVLRRK